MHGSWLRHYTKPCKEVLHENPIVLATRGSAGTGNPYAVRRREENSGEGSSSRRSDSGPGSHSRRDHQGIRPRGRKREDPVRGGNDGERTVSRSAVRRQRESRGSRGSHES